MAQEAEQKSNGTEFDLAAKGKGTATRASLRQAVRQIMLPRWKLLSLGLGLILVNRACGLVLPWSTKVVIDELIPAGDREALANLLFAVGGAITVQAVTGFLLTRLLSVEAQRLIAGLRARLQEHVLHLPLRYFDATQSGALVSRIMNDVEGVRNIVGTGLVQLVGGILTAIVSFFILLSIDPVLTVLSLIPLGLFGFVSSKAFKVVRPTFRERSRIQAEVTGRLTESLGGVRVIKGFHAEARERNVFKQGVQRLFENIRSTLTATSLVTSSATFLLGVASVLILGVGGSRIIQGALSVGDFVAFTLYLGFMVAPIFQMANIGTQITEAFAGLDRMNELLAIPREEDDPRRTVRLDDVKGHVEFDRVSFAYDEGKTVIEEASFVAEQGTVTAFVGSSGSGKTTLAALAASFLEPRSGTVRVDGVDLSTVELGSYRRHLGLVLQDDFLFQGTIRENILFARPEASEEALQDAVRGAYVDEFTKRFDDGLETIIGERGVKLSGGQRQRVAIARALLADPRILVLDEATSNLDTESESYIQKSLEQLLHGRTTLVIAHRLSTIRRADQILTIEGGRIAERGTHDELIALEGRYHQLYTVQARI